MYFFQKVSGSQEFGDYLASGYSFKIPVREIAFEGRIELEDLFPSSPWLLPEASVLHNVHFSALLTSWKLAHPEVYSLGMTE